MTQVEDENKEGQAPKTEPQFDFNHSVVLNENDNKFTLTAIEKINKDEFRAVLDVDYLKLYEFPSNKTEHINAFLNTALVKQNTDRIKIKYGFISPQNIRLKITKNKPFTLDENMKLKSSYEPTNKDLLIISIEYNDIFASNTYSIPLEYLKSGNKMVNIETELQQIRDDNKKLRREKAELKQELERKLEENSQKLTKKLEEISQKFTRKLEEHSQQLTKENQELRKKLNETSQTLQNRNQELTKKINNTNQTLTNKNQEVSRKLEENCRKISNQKQELNQEKQKRQQEDNTISNRTPKGMISMWSGSVNYIPNGWALCNGQNGTPDLRDRFIVSYGNTFNNIGNKGGSKEHTHNISVGNHTLTIDEMPSHNHSYQRFKAPDWIYEGNDKSNNNYAGWTCSARNNKNDQKWTNNTTNTSGGGRPHNHPGSSSSINHLPPYFTLAFIMKT